jgi:RNA-dependent RNA polymerase
MLYEAAELEESHKKRFVVFKEACAIYQLVYEYALQEEDVGKCGFAWKVAGHALCQFYAIKGREDTVLANMQVLREAFKRGA